MPRRALGALFLAICVAGCGSAAEKNPATSSENSPAVATTAAKPARPHTAKKRDIAGKGVGVEDFAAVERLVPHGLPVYCGGHKGNMVALTFDDGPGPYTHYVLDRLRQNKARATFFLSTKTFDLGFKGWVKKELVYGTVADHTVNHLLLTSLGEADMHSEIADAQDRIAKEAGFPVSLFRSPYGATNDRIQAYVKSRRMLQILWTIDSLDSQGANYLGIQKNVISQLRPGVIVLMHDNRGQAVRALRPILHAIRDKGLKAVTVPELLNHNPPSLAQLKAGPRGC